MPLTLHVGCSRKEGRPGFGSVGASCGVDLELDAALIDRDPEALRARVRSAFAACRRAVAEELARQAAAEGADPAWSPPRPPDPPPANGATEAAPARPSALPSPGRPSRPASEKQVAGDPGDRPAQRGGPRSRSCDGTTAWVVRRSWAPGRPRG